MSPSSKLRENFFSKQQVVRSLPLNGLCSSGCSWGDGGFHCRHDCALKMGMSPSVKDGSSREVF